MVNLSESGIFNSLMPEVAIEKVTLENSGFFPIEINPHIKPESSRARQIETPDSMKITVSFIIKEKFDDDLYGKWVQEVNLKKYLKIKVYQTLDPDILKLVSVSKEAAGLFDSYKFSQPEMRSLRIIAKNVLGTATDRETQNVFLDNVKSRTIPLGDDLRIEEEINDDGSKTENVYYKTTFEINTSEPEHLSYFCIVDFDLRQLSEDYNLRYPIAEQFSRTYVERIIDNYEPVSTSFVFLEQNGKIWTGPINYDPQEGTYKTGIEDTEDSRLLQRIPVANTKIQDFRNAKEIKKLKLNFEKIKTLFNRVGSRRNKIYSDSIRVDNFFKMDTISQDSNQNCNFSFSVDLKQLVIANSKYKNFVNSYVSRMSDSIASNAEIKYFKVFRRRVKESGHSKQKFVKFEKNTPDKTILTLSQKDMLLETVDTDDLFFEEIFSPVFPEVRQFNLTDREMPFITDGLYQYGVEIEVTDPFLPIVNRITENLKQQKKLLEEYYIECSKRSMSRYFQEDFNPHIKTPFTAENREKQFLEGNYDPATNSFTKSFTESQQNLIDVPVWKSVPVVFADALSFFVDELDENIVGEEIFKFISPTTGNPAGVNMVLSLFETLISKIERNISVQKTKNSLDKPTVSVKANTTFKVNYLFDKDTFDADLDNTVTVQFFDSEVVPESRKRTLRMGEVAEKPRNERRGLLSINGNQLRQTFENETLKFFNSSNPDINDPNDLSVSRNATDVSFSFLTPSSLGNRDTEVKLFKSEDKEGCKEETVAVDEVVRSIRNMSVSSRNSDDVVVVGQDFKILEKTLKKFMNSVGTAHSVTIELKEETPPEKNIPQTETIPARILPPDNLAVQISSDKGGLSRFIDSMALDSEFTMPPRTPNGTRTNPFKNIGANNKVRSVNLDSILNNFESLPEDKKSQIPLALQAQYLGSKGKSSVRALLQESSTTKQLKVGTIKEVQIMTGFEKGEDGRNLLNKPIWEKLTKEKYESLPNDRTITARLKDFQLPCEGNKSSFTRELKALDDTFLIKPDTSTRTVPKRDNFTISQQNIAVSLPEKGFEQIEKIAKEQTKFPTYAIKTALVNERSTKDVLMDKKVIKEVEKREAEIRISKQKTKKKTKRKKKIKRKF